MFAMPEIAARMFGAPLMLEASKAAIIAGSFGPRVLGGSVNLGVLAEPIRSWEGESLGPTLLQDGVAIIEVEGSLVNKGSWIGQSSGLTSYEGLGVQIADCMSPSVRAVVVEVDSFGGEVDGAFACAEALFELSAIKPTIAILTDHACSAGYLLAAACRSIVIPSTGYAGSIGVISMHVSAARAIDKAGFDVTILRAGAKKAKPTPFELMDEAELAERMDDMEALRVEFAQTVARYRGERMSLKSILATEAAVYRGTAALDAGLVDAVARPTEALAAFLAAIPDAPAS
jgi:ClpP class serine protease